MNVLYPFVTVAVKDSKLAFFLLTLGKQFLLMAVVIKYKSQPECKIGRNQVKILIIFSLYMPLSGKVLSTKVGKHYFNFL